jgi:hypothetical protein
MFISHHPARGTPKVPKEKWDLPEFPVAGCVLQMRELGISIGLAPLVRV